MNCNAEGAPSIRGTEAGTHRSRVACSIARAGGAGSIFDQARVNRIHVRPARHGGKRGRWVQVPRPRVPCAWG